jgi:hypothetical protein
MERSVSEPLPLAPVLHAYTCAGLPTVGDLGRLPEVGPRFAAIQSGTACFLYPAFLDEAKPDEFADALVRFHEACVRPPLHGETLRARAGLVRHGLIYVVRGRDPLAEKLDACIRADGPYHVPGLGPAFWSAIAQALALERHPGWLPETLNGLRRLGQARTPAGARPAAVYAQLLADYARIQAAEPALHTAQHVDHFLMLVSRMDGRTLDPASLSQADPLAAHLQQERIRTPLRDRLKERGRALAAAQEQLETALSRCDGKAIGMALAVADPVGSLRAPVEWGAASEDLALWVGRLWEAEAEAVPAVLKAFWQADSLPGAGLWLPAGVLHLRDAQRWQPWNEDVRRGFSLLDDSAANALPLPEAYRLFNEGVAWLRSRYQIHPLEAADYLAALTAEPGPRDKDTSRRFGGFGPDTFLFLRELADNNRRDWMERRRERYRFSVRGPLVELCRALAERYVEPVLHGTHGWQLDTTARNGRALTSICKNAYGKTQPYNTTLWIAFYQAGPLSDPAAFPSAARSGRGGARDAQPQFFVRLDAEGVRFGLRLGRKAREALGRFAQNVEHHGELLFRILRERGAFAECRFATECDSASKLRSWAAGRSCEVSRSLPADSPLLTGDGLVGEVLLTFDRLLPLWACAVEPDAGPFLRRLAGPPGADATGLAWAPFSDDDFAHQTHLGSDWLTQARRLLELKRQLILQGVPGTGKTHVARCLARLLTGGDDERIRLVQFHPAYSYEEFVEGIKVRSVPVDGRHEVTYPVEEGLLCAFAAEAAKRPSEAHVLVIDEINRGNLPRIFGELLYLLEYREQAVDLPYSRRRFRLPANLYLLGTMNAADRSVAVIDLALRRRFSYLEMPPDSRVLSSWLAAHVPAAGDAFASRVLTLFERLNARLRTDLGPAAQIGHSYFMVPDLDDDRLRLIWQHHVRPLLAEHFATQPARLAGYDLDALLQARTEAPRKRARVTLPEG